MTYAVAAAASSAVFALAGWHSRRSAAKALPPDTTPAWATAGDAALSSSTQDDVASAARVALGRVQSLLASQFVHADVAIMPGLVARLRGATLVDVIEEMLAAVIHAAPASRLLLTAVAQGDHIDFTITDDMQGPNPAWRMGQIRSLSERVALRGGTVQIKVQSTEGTTTTLRMLAVPKTGQRHGAPATSHQTPISAPC